MEAEKLEELIKLVDTEYKAKRFLTIYNILGSILVGILVIDYGIFMYAHFIISSSLPTTEEMALLFSSLALIIVILRLLAPSESEQRVRDLIEWNYKRLTKKRKEEELLLKGLMIMKNKQPKISLLEVYRKNPSLFDERELLDRLYE